MSPAVRGNSLRKITLTNLFNMKFKLPKALLVAVMSTLAAGSVVQATTPERPYYVHTEGGDITESIRSYQGKLSQADDRANKAQAYVKDGGNEATITGDIEMDTRLIVREGTVKISSATITQKSDGNFDFLIVGGKKVDGQTSTLELNNSHVVQTDKDWGGYMKTVTVGNKDGEGALVLKNGSSIQSGQLFHIGYSDYVNACHGSYKTADSNDNTTYFESETPGKGYVSLESGSKIYAGQGLRGGDMLLEISGNNSAFIVGSRAIDYTETIDSTRLGHIEGSTSTVKITDGGTMENYGLLYMSRVNAKTKVEVSGKNSLFAGYSTSLVADVEENTSSTVSLSATEGGRIHLTDATMGVNGGNSEVTIDIDMTSSYTGSSLTINEGTTMTNKGKVSLVQGTMITEWRDEANLGYENSSVAATATKTVESQLLMNGGLFINNGSLSAASISLNGGELTNSGTITGTIFVDGGTFTMADGAVAAGLTATSGTIYLNGNVTFTGAVVLGSPVSVATLITLSGESDALTLYINQGSTINADELTVGNGTSIAVILNEDETYTEGMELFTVTGSDAATVSAIESALGTNVTVYDNGNVEGTGTLVTNATGSITTNVVPEPATATLSLLALAGLCARRRRK